MCTIVASWNAVINIFNEQIGDSLIMLMVYKIVYPLFFSIQKY